MSMFSATYRYKNGEQKKTDVKTHHISNTFLNLAHKRISFLHKTGDFAGQAVCLGHEIRTCLHIRFGKLFKAVRKRRPDFRSLEFPFAMKALQVYTYVGPLTMSMKT